MKNEAGKSKIFLFFPTLLQNYLQLYNSEINIKYNTKSTRRR